MIAILAISVFAGVKITDTSTGRTANGATIWDAISAFLSGGSNRVTGRAVGGIHSVDSVSGWSPSSVAPAGVASAISFGSSIVGGASFTSVASFGTVSLVIPGFYEWDVFTSTTLGSVTLSCSASGPGTVTPTCTTGGSGTFTGTPTVTLVALGSNPDVIDFSSFEVVYAISAGNCVTDTFSSGSMVSVPQAGIPQSGQGGMPPLSLSGASSFSEPFTSSVAVSNPSGQVYCAVAGAGIQGSSGGFEHVWEHFCDTVGWQAFNPKVVVQGAQFGQGPATTVKIAADAEGNIVDSISFDLTQCSNECVSGTCITNSDCGAGSICWRAYDGPPMLCGNCIDASSVVTTNDRVFCPNCEVKTVGNFVDPEGNLLSLGQGYYDGTLVTYTADPTNSRIDFQEISEDEARQLNQESPFVQQFTDVIIEGNTLFDTYGVSEGDTGSGAGETLFEPEDEKKYCTLRYSCNHENNKGYAPQMCSSFECTTSADCDKNVNVIYQPRQVKDKFNGPGQPATTQKRKLIQCTVKDSGCLLGNLDCSAQSKR